MGHRSSYGPPGRARSGYGAVCSTDHPQSCGTAGRAARSYSARPARRPVTFTNHARFGSIALMLTRTVALRPTESQVICKLLSRLKEGKVWFWEWQGLGVDIRLPEPLIRQVCQRHGPLARFRIIFLTQGQQRQLRNI